MATRQTQPSVQILEKGNIAFFYRPKEGVLHPKGPQDIERAYFLLLPDDQQHHMNRLVNVAHGVFPAIVPGKAAPEERDWAFVQDASHDPKEVIKDLQKNIGAPPTGSSQRARPWAREVGEGRYAIARHGDHTHLVYYLAEPKKPEEAQKELKVKKEASYVISVKDPFAPSEIELKEKPNYPANLRNKFNGHGWIPIDPTSYLDYKYTQFLLLGARANVRKELGITLNPSVENSAEKQVAQVLEQEEKQAEKRGVSILEPLMKGQME